MQLRAAIFDLDNTLYDANAAYSAAVYAAGIAENDAIFAKARLYTKKILPQKHVSARNRLLYLKSYFQFKGMFSAQTTLKAMEAYESTLQMNIFKQWEKLKRNSLFELLCQKVPCVIITNENTRTQLIKLNAIDPTAKYFKKILTSEEYGVEKPNPLLLRAAIDYLKVSDQECLVVGDSLTNDIEPALKLGCRTVLTKEFSQIENCPQGVDLVSQLDEIQKYWI